MISVCLNRMIEHDLLVTLSSLNDSTVHVNVLLISHILLWLFITWLLFIPLLFSSIQRHLLCKIVALYIYSYWSIMEGAVMRVMQVLDSDFFYLILIAQFLSICYGLLPWWQVCGDLVGDTVSQGVSICLIQKVGSSRPWM